MARAAFIFDNERCVSVRGEVFEVHRENGVFIKGPRGGDADSFIEMLYRGLRGFCSYEGKIVPEPVTQVKITLGWQQGPNGVQETCWG